MAELSDLELLAELGVETAPEPKRALTPLQERIIAGFEDIQRFVAEHGHLPRHGDDRDIFERLYAVRLERLRSLLEARELLASIDHDGLLDATRQASVAPEELGDDALLAELGIAPGAPDDITKLRHVAPRAEKRAAEEIANREKCEDFESFKPQFERVQAEMTRGARQAKVIDQTEVTLAEVHPGKLFIVAGQMAMIADTSDEFVTDYERKDRRVRVIYDNGTEVTMLARSFQKALYRDETARRITDLSAGPLFGDVAEPDDLASGTIYVLRSKSAHPYVAEHRELIHKIGVTGQSVAHRVANARNDPTFLLADVEVVAEYQLFNINRSKMEGLIHKALAAARLDLAAGDRFGRTVQPREWFLIPFQAIDDLIAKISDGSVTRYRYEPTQARFVPTTE
ncbi:GIY-YIG nuclease family protein [Novosphingobium sp. Fuku2-ISO-50]|uniref:GIY-YIG nuclease family protein n=1 Tax=Novosphingobium sp. Fuku2-ISO-50 TaxID=1739114 RepID=UPI00076D29C6|nr:GIY-YIG nuclease family protein [Novosphingobium sp. Fuku2-ISO-50]KUR74215.1 hypothetical protein AQZ50_18080 [Novosphingobium sp. Fuku2-ISO-50]